MLGDSFQTAADFSDILACGQNEPCFWQAELWIWQINKKVSK
jgi:hypothetical protein